MDYKMKFTIQEVFFFLILVSLSIAFFKVIEPFVIDIIIAVILVSMFSGPFSYIGRKFKSSRQFTTVYTLIFVIVVLVIPLFFIGFLVSAEAAKNYEDIKEWIPVVQDWFAPDNLRAEIAAIPYVGEYIDVNQIDFTQFQDMFKQAMSFSAELMLDILKSSFVNLTSFIIHFLYILILMYFLFMDGHKLLARIHYLLPLPDKDENELFDEIKKITDAVLVNTFIIGVIEGAFGGLLFTILGIRSPVFWGVIMFVLSMIPIVGANFILIPTSILMAITGDWTAAIILLVIGAGGIILNQNLVKPELVGNNSGMHPAIVLLATIGGIIWLGLPGFIIGPLLAGMFLVIWRQFGKKYEKELEIWNK